MSTDYIQINNNCPDIRLWQQYYRNEIIVNFFIFLKNYFQTIYFDFLEDQCMPALSIINAFNDYLQYYALSILNILIPVNITSGTKYDSGFKYDSGVKYDESGGTKPITLAQFQSLLMWAFDWSRPNWDIPTLYYLIGNITGLTYDQIDIEQDDTNLDLFHFTLTDTSQTEFFMSMLLYYQNLLNLPFGIYFDITLV